MLADILIGVIAIILGSIPLIDRSNQADRNGMTYAGYKLGGVALIIYGFIYIIYQF